MLPQNEMKDTQTLASTQHKEFKQARTDVLIENLTAKSLRAGISNFYPINMLLFL